MDISTDHNSRDYFKSGEVKQISIGTTKISGLIQGSNYRPYKTEFTLNQNCEIEDSSCSCPVGFACKHVAALALAAVVKSNWRAQVVSLLPDRDKQKNLHKLQILVEFVPGNSPTLKFCPAPPISWAQTQFDDLYMFNSMNASLSEILIFPSFKKNSENWCFTTKSPAQVRKSFFPKKRTSSHL